MAGSAATSDLRLGADGWYQDGSVGIDECLASEWPVEAEQQHLADTLQAGADQARLDAGPREILHTVGQGEPSRQAPSCATSGAGRQPVPTACANSSWGIHCGRAGTATDPR